MSTIEYPDPIPVTVLTHKFIDELVLHTTVESLRRAADDAIKMVPIEVKGMPKIYYISANRDPLNPLYTYHALLPEICKYLLHRQVSPEPPEPPSPYESSTLNPANGLIDEDHSYTEEGTLVFKHVPYWTVDELEGYIDERSYLQPSISEDGDYIGCEIILNSENLHRFPDARVAFNVDTIIPLENLVHYSDVVPGAEVISYYQEVTEPGETFNIRIDWMEGASEYFVMAVSQDINL